MAIVQISQIQVRRGLNSDLPQLASGEMGWSIDTRQLYIGNGTTAEGAPTQGITEILTQYSNLLNVGISYTFQGTPSGYTSQTGPNILTPVVRPLQQVLDDEINIKDFGAVGDGNTDDTAAINRAIQQIYYSGLNASYPNVRRTIKFPAGTYKVTGQILIPPYLTIIGDGRENTIISSTSTAGSAFTTCDSLYQTGANLGNGSATLPKSISIRNMNFALTGSAVLFYIDSAVGVVFDQVKFSGGTNNIAVYNSKQTSNYIKIEDCILSGSTVAPIYTDSGSSTGIITRTNYFDTSKLNLSSGTTTSITTLTTGAGVVRYQMSNSSNKFRLGELKYNYSNGTLSFDDEWTEPVSSLGANLFASTTGNLTCTVTENTTLKYNITQFI